MIKVRLLGTATSQGVPVIGCECEVCTSLDSKDKRLRSACWVEVDNKIICIDIGPDFRQQMLKGGGKEIHAILVTHEHNDHTAGLDDVRPFNFKYEKDMPVYALHRVAKYIRTRFDYIFEHQTYPGAPRVELTSIDGNSPFMVENIEVVPIHIMHGTLPILGYRVGKFAYLTDVKTIAESEYEKLNDLDVLVLSALREKEHHSHLTLQQAIELAQKINAKTTYFTHFSHDLGTHKQISEKLPKNMFAGYDGLEIEI